MSSNLKKDWNPSLALHKPFIGFQTKGSCVYPSPIRLPTLSAWKRTDKSALWIWPWLDS